MATELATVFFFGPFFFLYYILVAGSVSFMNFAVAGLGTALWVAVAGALGNVFA